MKENFFEWYSFMNGNTFVNRTVLQFRVWAGQRLGTFVRIAMNMLKVATFIVQLKDRALEQIDNTLFAQLLYEHGLFLCLPIIHYIYLLSRDVENVSVHVSILLAIINLVCIIILNGNYCLVNRVNSKYIISRLDNPDRVDSILVECADRSADRAQSNTKMYALLWKSFPAPGHLSLQLFDVKKSFLSRWPGESIKFINPASIKQPVAAVFNHTVTDDIIDENGYKPDYIIIIPEGTVKQCNINAMIAWYESVAKSPTGIYKGKFKNCADLVKQALKAGKFYLSNPSLRLLKFGLSIPNDIADRIVYTLCLRHSSRLIQLLHHALTVAVWSLSMHFVAVIFGLIKPYVPVWFATFLLQGFWFHIYHLFRALD